MSRNTLTTNEIRQLLTALDMELQRQGKAATIFIVGSTSMALAYNADRATEDVAGTFQPRDVALNAAKTVAKQSHRPELDSSWLDDVAVQMMAQNPGDHPRSEKIGPALTISIAPPEFVLSMKAIAASQGPGDIDDAVLLFQLLNITTDGQLKNIVATYFPGRIFNDQELFFERIFDSL